MFFTSKMFFLSQILLILGILGLFVSSIFLLKTSWMLKMKIFSVFSIEFDFLLILDWISITFFSMLLMIVSCVLKFSKIYMSEELNNYQFMKILLLFVLSMSCLIFFPKFIFLLMGWDGLGLTSFLLIIYYFSKSSWSAGFKTYLMNRLGDAFLIVSITFMFSQGHWKIFAFDYLWKMVYLIFILGFMTKSAMFPFSSWLPAAMAAPTPVSALVHSSTLVTAGIYLMIRLNYFFPQWMLFFLGVLSIWTIYISSLSACFEWDSKKIIAYSTLSNLGLMGFSLSVGLNLFAFFHLLSHAVFKALLFMCVGFFMKISYHFQDLRSLKNFWWNNPFCKISILISILALSGFPFLAGFYSKDQIIELNLKNYNLIFFLFFLFSIPLTSYYSFRLFFFLLQKNKKKIFFLKKKLKKKMVFPLMFSSIFLGYFLKKFLFMKIFPCFIFKMFILFLVSLGFFLALNYSFNKNWFFSKLFFNKALKKIFMLNFSNSGKAFFNLLDSGWSKFLVSKKKTLVKKTSNYVNYSLYYFFNPKFFFMISWIIFIIFSFNKKI